MDPENPLYAISYVSESLIPEDQLTDELAAIQGKSHENNAASGLTGKLIYCRSYFVQRLEGPKNAVDAAMARIRKDSRHSGFKVISMQRIEERLYAEWDQLGVITDGPLLDELDETMQLLARRPVFSLSDEEVNVMLSTLEAAANNDG